MSVKIAKKHCWCIILQFSLKSASLGYRISVCWNALLEELVNYSGCNEVFLELFSQCRLLSCFLGILTFFCGDSGYTYATVFFKAKPQIHRVCPASHALWLPEGATPMALCAGLTVWCLSPLGPLGKCIGLNLNPSSLSCACLCMINFLKIFEK